MTPAMFVSESAGASVLEMAQMVALKPEAYEPAVAAALPGEVVQQSMLASKKHKSKEFELGCSVGESSSKSEARVKHDAVVDDLLVLMDDTQRSSLYEGFSTIPARFQRELARRTVSNAGGTDSLRGARDALRRLREWYITKFGLFAGFRIKEAVIGWFLLENLVPDDLDGHASQSLVAGLRFASVSLHFPFNVSSAPMRSLAKAPTKTPKQAPSASVRVVYHFWQVACDTAHSMPLRGAAAAFFVMCLSALRGIDAQRSSFDGIFGGESRYEYFTAVAWDSKQQKSMPWGCPSRAFGSSGWMEPLRFIWGDRDYLFPSIARGVKLAAAVEFLAKPASSYTMLRFLREILALSPLSMAEEDAKRLRRHSFRHWIANIIRILRTLMMVRWYLVL